MEFTTKKLPMVHKIPFL